MSRGVIVWTLLFCLVHHQQQQHPPNAAYGYIPLPPSLPKNKSETPGTQPALDQRTKDVREYLLWPDMTTWVYLLLGNLIKISAYQYMVRGDIACLGVYVVVTLTT